MSTMDIEKFLQGSGAKSAAFAEVGTIVSGTVVGDPQVQQQKDMDGELKTYKDGNPAMQLVIKVQTTDRDPEDPDDDGVRAVYFKGQMKSALADACRRVGVKAPEAGGTLAVKFTGTEPAATKGFNDKKLYACKYTAPATPTAAAVDDFLGTTTTPAPAAKTDDPPF